MVELPNGQKISTFRDIYKLLPKDLKERVYNLWKIPQRKDFHPEGNTLKHVITVVERAIRTGDIDLVLTALFHDIGKDETFAYSSKGMPTAHNHEKVSRTLVKDSREWIKDMGGNPVVIYYLVSQHMRVKRIDIMRKSKQDFLRKNPNFDKLNKFKHLDRGGLKVEKRIIEYKDGDKMPIPDEIRKLAAAYKDHGEELYVVGGAVRDFMLDKNPKDYDLATGATPDKSLDIIKKLGYKTTEVGKSFGVVVAIPPSGEEYEIATFREDVGAGRRPDDVKFTDIGTDVLRRDLTINAMFYDIDDDKVVDLVQGTDDLKTGTIRTVGDPATRFGEDPLRKLRALRFFARLGKKIDPKTLEALKDTNLDGVSPERIREEFMKSIKTAQSPKKYMILADKLGYLDDIVGDMSYSRDFIDSSDPEVQLGAILVSESPKIVKKRLQEIKYSRNEIRNIVIMVEIAKIAKNRDFDRIYPLMRAYKVVSSEKIRDFASHMGLTRFIDALDGIDMKKVDVSALSRKYSKADLGNAIKSAVKSQFVQLYKN